MPSTHTMEHYSKIKKKKWGREREKEHEFLSFETLWTAMERIMLSKVKSERERQIPDGVT